MTAHKEPGLHLLLLTQAMRMLWAPLNPNLDLV